MEDWLLWIVSFVMTISPTMAPIVQRRKKPHPAVILTLLVFPVLSLAAMTWSYVVGATLLLGSGFLVACLLVLRSRRLLGVEQSFAARLICAEVLAFLSMVAAGGAICILLWRNEAFAALVSGSGSVSTDVFFKAFTIDLETFYLARPLLPLTFIVLGIAAAIALFREPLQTIAQLIYGQLNKETNPLGQPALPNVTPPRGIRRLRRWLPYVILAVSVALGFVITLYPYTFVGVDRVLGSDSWLYLDRLGRMKNLEVVLQILGGMQREGPVAGYKGVFLLFLYVLRSGSGLSAEWVVRLTPALLSAFLALSTFALVKEGTDRLWAAALAALLSVVSAQTSLGMGAGILANWFALSLANTAFALLVRSTRNHSLLAAAGSVLVSLLLLGSHAELWVIGMTELALVLFASILAFQKANRREWKLEVGIVSGVLLAATLVPIAILSILVVPGLGPLDWLARGWVYVTQQTTSQVFEAVLTTLEQTLDFAGNRVDLPFLTLLSIIGMLDQALATGAFRRIISAMVLVPFIAATLTPDLYFTWRGLYLIPLYLTGALGTESIIRRVNGQEGTWRSRDRLAFAGTFAAYVFLSHLSYSLRALELLIMVGTG
jgi:hypothetical protein